MLPTGFVFEDLEFLSKPIWKVEGIRELWFNGRHVGAFALCAFQYIMEIKMALRGMFDYGFFMMDPNVQSRIRIREQFFGMFPSMEMFENVFFACTTNFKALVVDLRATSYNIEDSVFWYKASDHGQFRVGVADVWNRDYDRERLEAQRAEKAKKSRGLVKGRSGIAASAASMARKRDRVEMTIRLDGCDDCDGNDDGKEEDEDGDDGERGEEDHPGNTSSARTSTNGGSGQ